MIKKKRQFVLFPGVMILAFTLFSCVTNDSSSGINLSKVKNVSLSDVFSSVKVIQLETNDNALISEIRRIEYFDSHYYILDSKSQQIFWFSENGDFVDKIHSPGKGVGEYHYIADFSIDKANNQLILLDPVMQKVHFFDLEGSFLSTHNIITEKVLGLNRVYPLPDSLLLFTSLTYENLLIYSLKENKIVFADYTYDVTSTLHAFSPWDNVCYYDNKVLFLVPLTRDIVDLSTYKPVTYFTWDFGSDNNSDDQINQLLDEIVVKNEIPEYFQVAWQAVGKNKILNHHILKSFENNRFRIAVVENTNQFKFVVIDKKEDSTLVFGEFEEGIRLAYEHMQQDRAIAFYQHDFTPRIKAMIEKDDLSEYYFERNHRVYSTDFLDEADRHVVENHDPLNINPFLVVYKFKE